MVGLVVQCVIGCWVVQFFGEGVFQGDIVMLVLWCDWEWWFGLYDVVSVGVYV